MPPAEDQLTFGGLTMGAGTAYRLLSVSGFDDAPDVISATTRHTSGHGALVGDQFYAERVITARIAVTGSTPTALNAALDALRAAITLASTSSALSFNQAGRGARYVLAKPRQRAIPRDANRRLAVALIEWVAGDPRIYNDEAATVVTIATTATALSNSGTFSTPTVIRLNGPLTNPTVVDAARGRQINMTITIASPDYVELDGLARTAIRSTDGASVRSNLTRWDDMDVPPAGASWVKTGGAGVVTATYRPARI